MQLLKQFSDIFKNKTTGKFTFTNSKGVIIAEGQYKKGKPVKIWKHYYENGNIKTTYDIKNNITTQYSVNGKSIINKDIGIYEEYYVSGHIKIKGQYFKNRRVGLWKWYNDDGSNKGEFDYKDGANGNE